MVRPFSSHQAVAACGSVKPWLMPWNSSSALAVCTARFSPSCWSPKRSSAFLWMLLLKRPWEWIFSSVPTSSQDSAMSKKARKGSYSTWMSAQAWAAMAGVSAATAATISPM